MRLNDQRNQVVTYGRKLVSAHLTTGTGGNLSICDRKRQRIAISPSAISYSAMRPEDVVICDLRGKVTAGHRKPSSEIDAHLTLYKKRPDISAVVHTHSTYATTFACLNREIPAVHYLIGYCGEKVPLAPYATPGSRALAQNAANSIGDANAVLLANHGLISVGEDISMAFKIAQEIEMVARLYYQTLCIGTPRILNHVEMTDVLEEFKHYGRS